MRKKIISFFVAMMMFSNVFFCVSNNIVYADSESIISGKCGENIVWNINPDTETLVISGKGKMTLDLDNNYGPWIPHRSDFRYVVIEEGVTSIAENAFDGCVIKKINIPSTVETIEYGALKDESTAYAVGNVVDIEFASDSKIRTFEIGTNLKKTTWYKNLNNGAVYIGTMLFTYNGTLSAGKTVTVKDGTTVINREAFLNQSGLTNLIIPDSVERIGKDAFAGTSWYDNQPDGFVYAGNVLYDVKNPTSGTDTTIKEGTVSVSEYALYNYQYGLNDLTIPASVKYIDDYAFAYIKYVRDLSFAEGCEIKEINEGAFCGSAYMMTKDLALPDSIERLGDGAFYDCLILSDLSRNVKLPDSLKEFGECVFEESSVITFSVDEENSHFSTDEYGVLFNKDKTTLVAAPSCLAVEEYIVPDTVTRIEVSAFSSVQSGLESVVLPDSINEIGGFAFYNSHIKTINIPYGIKVIEPYTFASSWLGALPGKIYIPKSVEVIKTRAFSNLSAPKAYVLPESVNYIAANAFYGRNSDAVFYCYENSTAQYFAENNQIPCIIYNDPDTQDLEALLEKHKNLSRSLFTEESLSVLDGAISEVDLITIYYTEEQVNGWVNNINLAFDNLEPLPADYTKLDSAKDKALSLDRSLYTEESLEKLDALLEKSDEYFDSLNQSKADELAYLINDAIMNLEYLPADYAKVNEAVAEAEKLDRILYSQSTLTVLDQSIASVDYTLNITQQNIVDGFADRIYTAIASLTYADVVLRNEPNGVVVSTTADIVYPTTALTVDMLDPSSYETANFAVGGNIKSVSYYDINLIRDGEKVQPDGTVYVKIKVPDGVKPEKCRVYHVTDDPVDPLVHFSSTLDGNYIVFETNHFSEFAVIEVETYLSGISITKMPLKLDYALNEKLDFSGMEVTALYSDGKTETVSDYDISNVDISSIGTKTVTVYYTLGEITKSASFEINVTADKLAADITLDGESINEYNKKVAWYKGYSSESLQLECNLPDSENYTVKWSSDNSKVLVDESGKVTNKGFFFPRKATITVTVTDSAGNTLATDNIVVRFYKFNFQLSGILSVFTTLRKNGILFF